MPEFDKKPVVSILKSGTIDANFGILLDYAIKLLNVYVLTIKDLAEIFYSFLEVYSSNRIVVYLQ